MDLDKQKFQYHGLKWLFELELLSDPQVINTIKANILGSYPWVLDLEYLSTYEPRKQLLMWLHTPKYLFFRKRKERELCQEVHVLLEQLFPKYEIRVITDRHIFDLALENVRKALINSV